MLKFIHLGATANTERDMLTYLQEAICQKHTKNPNDQQLGALEHCLLLAM
jgi:hypothetical protein